MQFIYNGEYSLYIKPLYYDVFPVPDEGYNTWDDLNLIPTSKLVIAPPAFNISIIQPPYSNTIIDLTDRNIGTYKYGQSSGDWEFIIDSSHYTSNAVISIIEYRIHGYYSKVRLVNDETIYIGRVYISSIDQEDEYTKITLSYILKPCDDIKYDENYGEISTNSDSGGGGSGQTPSQDTTNMILLTDPNPPVGTSWRLVKSGHGLPTYKQEEYKSSNKIYRTFIIPDSLVKIKSIVSNSTYMFMIILYSFNKNDEYKILGRFESVKRFSVSTPTRLNSKIVDGKYGNGYKYSSSRSGYFKIDSSKSTYLERAIGIRTEDETPSIEYEISYFIYVNRNSTGIIE